MRLPIKETNMHEIETTPTEGTRTEERLLECRAVVWWDDAAGVTFPTREARRKALDPLKATMQQYGTTTLYYHAEEIDGLHVTYETAEHEGSIYVAVMIAAPIIVEAIDFDDFLIEATDEVANTGTVH
jgi:hypothetical protein